jgi:hypothetical protein
MEIYIKVRNTFIISASGRAQNSYISESNVEKCLIIATKKYLLAIFAFTPGSKA